MEKVYEIEYHFLVDKIDIPKIPSIWLRKILIAIDEKLTTNPDLYGKPLRRSLVNYRKLRVGDYRVIFKISGKKVKIFIIEHRKNVYLMVERRVSLR
jgi:mRNA interferase RelE/StbE